MKENEEIMEEEIKPFAKTTENVAVESGSKSGWGKRSVTRRFLIAALAITVITNAAVSAGALALISKSGKAANPEKTVTEEQNSGQSDNSAGDQFGNGYSDPYGDLFGGYGDQYNNGYGDQYSNGYSDLYGGYGDQYNNGYSDQYSNGYGSQYDDQYGNQYNDNGQDNSGDQSSSVSIGIVISENSGVYVAQVTGNNAKKAGFAEGDKIVSIDGKTIGSSSDLISEVQSHKAGDTVTIVVERNGQSIEIKTVLE